MRKLGLTLHILFWLACIAPAFADNTVGPTNQIICNQVAQASPASATTTLLITGIAGKSIFLCGWHVTSNQATATTFQFIAGTGATCTGTPVNLTPAFSIQSTAPSADHISIASYQVPAGFNVCLVTTGTTVGDAAVGYYSQF
jgi:hypothetical protein